MGKIKGKVYHNNDKALWENDDGTEMYLMPGTPAYEEYIKSLKMQSCNRPEDETHIEWEEHNEDVQQDRIDRIYKLDKAKETARRKYIQRMRKRTMARVAERVAEKDLHRNVFAKEFEDEVFDDGVTTANFYKASLGDFKEEHREKLKNGRELPRMKEEVTGYDPYDELTRKYNG